MKKNILNIIPFFIGIGCLVGFNLIGSKVLSDGTIVEPFYLIPIGWIFFFIGILGLIVRFLFSCKTKKQI